MLLGREAAGVKNNMFPLPTQARRNEKNCGGRSGGRGGGWLEYYQKMIANLVSRLRRLLT